MNQSPDDLAFRYIDEGHELRYQLKFLEAIAAYDRAIAISPNGKWVGNAYYYKGLCLQEEKRWAEAANAFRRALEVDPRDDQAKRDLEYVLRRMK